MKTYKHLWEQFISAENFELAARRAVRNKRRRKSTRRFLDRADEKLAALRRRVERGEYKTSQYKTFMVHEPKPRMIYCLPLYPDHIVHHALMNVLAPLWQKLFIYDSYACIPGRGLHAASRRCAEMVRKYKYVLQCDIRKFYPSINHDIMMRIVAHKISDVRILGMLDEIVRSVGGEYGLPIGNLTSQWLGNLYMNELDMFVKHELHAHGYVRYCDDFCLFSDNRAELNIWADRLREYLGCNLKLEFSKCYVKKTCCGVSFVGYRHFRNFVILTKSAARKVKRRFINILGHPHVSPRVRSQLASYSGWLAAGCTHNFRHCLVSHAPVAVPLRFMNLLNVCFI